MSANNCDKRSGTSGRIEIEREPSLPECLTRQGLSQAPSDRARRRYEAVAADCEAGRSSLDLLLRTRVSVAEAERSYSESIVAYNKALIELAYREGLLLRENAIVVADADAPRKR